MSHANVDYRKRVIEVKATSLSALGMRMSGPRTGQI